MEDRCANCGDLAIGWCLICDAPLCPDCGVAAGDGDRLCRPCAGNARS